MTRRGRHRRGRLDVKGIAAWSAGVILSAAIVYGLVYLLIGIISAWGTS